MTTTTIPDVTSRLAVLARLLRSAASDPTAVADHARGVVAAADELLAGDLPPLTYSVLAAVRATVVIFTRPDVGISHPSSSAEVAQGLRHLLCDVSGTPRW